MVVVVVVSLTFPGVPRLARHTLEVAVLLLVPQPGCRVGIKDATVITATVAL